MEENTLIVQWVQQCLERRISSYRWALERLVIQAPDNMAADADRLIGELAAQTANPPVAAQPVIGTRSACAASDFVSTGSKRTCICCAFFTRTGIRLRSKTSGTRSAWLIVV